jgi:hypothetical protein
MCDGAAPGTRTGSARDIVSPSAPDRPRTRERAGAVSSRRERAALPFALPHGDHWQGRPGPARARSWRESTTRRCSSSRCQAARSWEWDRRSRASPPAPRVPQALGLASPQHRHPGRSAHQVQPQPPEKREWLAQYPYHSLARVEETLARDSMATATATAKVKPGRHRSRCPCTARWRHSTRQGTARGRPRRSRRTTGWPAGQISGSGWC